MNTKCVVFCEAIHEKNCDKIVVSLRIVGSLHDVYLVSRSLLVSSNE